VAQALPQEMLPEERYEPQLANVITAVTSQTVSCLTDGFHMAGPIMAETAENSLKNACHPDVDLRPALTERRRLMTGLLSGCCD
jgi:hypothetical protein